VAQQNGSEFAQRCGLPLLRLRVVSAAADAEGDHRAALQKALRAFAISSGSASGTSSGRSISLCGSAGPAHQQVVQ